MKLLFLGTGGAMPTPRAFCKCRVCSIARKKGEPYRRNSSSLFIKDNKTVIDCGEDISDSLNRRRVEDVDNLFITHWHPDHTFGLRPILEANYLFRAGKVRKQINVYIPKKVYETLLKRFPAIDYLINVLKVGKLNLVEDGDEIDFGKIKIGVVGYKGKESETYAYLIQEDNKRVLYSPCDTIHFDNYKKFKDLDLLISECGIFSKGTSEMKFEELLKRIREINPKKSIMTHIEEIELNIFGFKKLQLEKKQNKDIRLDFAFDGMEVKI